MHTLVGTNILTCCQVWRRAEDLLKDVESEDLHSLTREKDMSMEPLLLVALKQEKSINYYYLCREVTTGMGRRHKSIMT